MSRIKLGPTLLFSQWRLALAFGSSFSNFAGDFRWQQEEQKKHKDPIRKRLTSPPHESFSRDDLATGKERESSSEQPTLDPWVVVP